MAAIKDQAIVLRRLDYSETSQVLAFLTREHGSRRLIAKGVKRSTKRKFATGIDLLERGQLMFVAKSPGVGGLGTLTEWQQTDAHLGLRSELQRLYCAQYAAEITAAMTEEADPHPGLFNALGELLASLATGGAALPLVVEYQCAALTSAGLWPDLTRCVKCDKPAPPGRAAYFSAHQGGLLCRNCEPASPEKRKVSRAALTALREHDFSGGPIRGAFELLDYAISHAIGRQPSLAKFVVPRGS